MCTLSVISLGSGRGGSGERGFRVVASRDEQRDRPAAIGPSWQTLSPRTDAAEPRTLAPASRAIWPTDPKGGGTWIAAGDTGLVLCLMNLNLRPAPKLPARLTSRGAIVPLLANSPGADAAMRGLGGLDLTQFAPFRLVAIEPHAAGARTLEARWDRASLVLEAERTSPACFVSSGLGDARVLGRLALFDTMITAGEETVRMQDQFHAHVWPDRPEVSVLMSRADARTVSITAVEVLTGEGTPRVKMSYTPVPADLAAEIRRTVVTTAQPALSVAASGRGV